MKQRCKMCKVQLEYQWHEHRLQIESSEICCRIYTMEWHNLSLAIKKLLLFIMQGNHHSAVLNFYGIWVPTFENLSTVRNISLRIQNT
ncbi:hypothetical protein E2986_11837 [Frieseomelitta varia]|uniref:Uncharacterized protein n=1 Tax=Frieseomelitta varia TaxID=561572 RepID=A0A833RR74_9HYME|nr:hypothetical protein E2986_11837 [Frieseomelitta varia]